MLKDKQGNTTQHTGTLKKGIKETKNKRKIKLSYVKLAGA